jgi:hypothetical protein
MTLNLTRKEMEALQHRLEVPDALQDVFAEDYAPEDVSTIVMEIMRGCNPHTYQVNLEQALGYSEGITKAVLRDCVEGSTWVAVALGESERKGSAAIRTLEGLAGKIHVVVQGEPLKVPTC